MTLHPRPELTTVVRTRDPRDRSRLLGLDRNEWPAPLSAELFANFQARLSPRDLSDYPTLEPLYQRLAASLGVPREHLLLGAGADGLIGSCFEVFPGEVVTLSPSYAMYEVYARIHGAPLKRVEFGPGRQLVAGQLLEAVTSSTRLVTLANPNQPTGTVLPREVIRGVLERATDAVVLLDEAYHHFTDKNLADLVEEFPQLVVVRTFSKACALAGMRIGYALGQPEVLRLLETVRPTCEINAAAVRACEFLLDHPELPWDNARQSAASQAWLAARFASLGLVAHECPTNFMLFEVPEPAALVAALEREGVLLKGPFPHPCLEGMVRVSTGPLPVMERFWEVFERVWRGLRP